MGKWVLLKCLPHNDVTDVAGLLPLKCLSDNDVADVATFRSYMYSLPQQPTAHSLSPTAYNL
jgi:hypothetical protein